MIVNDIHSILVIVMRVIFTGMVNHSIVVMVNDIHDICDGQFCNAIHSYYNALLMIFTVLLHVVLVDHYLMLTN